MSRCFPSLLELTEGHQHGARSEKQESENRSSMEASRQPPVGVNLKRSRREGSSFPDRPRGLDYRSDNATTERRNKSQTVTSCGVRTCRRSAAVCWARQHPYRCSHLSEMRSRRCRGDRRQALWHHFALQGSRPLHRYAPTQCRGRLRRRTAHTVRARTRASSALSASIRKHEACQPPAPAVTLCTSAT